MAFTRGAEKDFHLPKEIKQHPYWKIESCSPDGSTHSFICSLAIVAVGVKVGQGEVQLNEE